MGQFHVPWSRRLASLTAATAVALSVGAAPATAEGSIADVGGTGVIADSYIVVFKDTVVGAHEVADKSVDLAGRSGAKVGHTYSSALRGFAAKMSERAAKRLAADPAVAYVVPDSVMTVSTDQPNPPSWGLDRIDQRDRPLNANYSYATTAPTVHASAPARRGRS